MWSHPERVEPGTGQESVWDYPRPPVVVPSTEHVVVELGGGVVCETHRALRVLETSHPPTYYLPVEDWRPRALEPAPGLTVCEFKGLATSFSVVGADGTVARAAGWTFANPWPGFESLSGHVAVYPGRMDRVTVDGELVRPQPGEFYGGWITGRVVGPFKGGPGSRGW